MPVNRFDSIHQLLVLKDARSRCTGIVPSPRIIAGQPIHELKVGIMATCHALAT